MTEGVDESMDQSMEENENENENENEKVDPEVADARQQILGLMEGRSVASLREATRVYCERFPESAWGWLISVPTLIDLGLYKDAQRALRKASKAIVSESDSQNEAVCSYWSSVLYKEQGKLKRAQRCIEEAIEVAPEEGAYWVSYGEILLKRGKPRKAGAAYLAAVEINGSDIDEAFLNLALLLRSQRRYDDALKMVQRALEVDPDYMEAHALRQDLESVLSGSW